MGAAGAADRENDECEPDTRLVELGRVHGQ
jgi:hypothetical protein